MAEDTEEKARNEAKQANHSALPLTTEDDLHAVYRCVEHAVRFIQLRSIPMMIYRWHRMQRTGRHQKLPQPAAKSHRLFMNDRLPYQSMAWCIHALTK